jgi:hypothetical protein
LEAVSKLPSNVPLPADVVGGTSFVPANSALSFTTSAKADVAAMQVISATAATPLRNIILSIVWSSQVAAQKGPIHVAPHRHKHQPSALCSRACSILTAAKNTNARKRYGARGKMVSDDLHIRSRIDPSMLMRRQNG